MRKALEEANAAPLIGRSAANRVAGIIAEPDADLDDEFSPLHYFAGTPYEVADILAAWERMAGAALTHRKQSAIEYLVRSGRKIHLGKSARESELADLRKAVTTIELAIRAIERDTRG